MPDVTTVYPARKIITMNPEDPAASAVAVRQGRILGVGRAEDLVGWIKRSPFTPVRVDPTFTGKILIPGLVDAHTHLEVQALIYSGHFVAQIPWPRPEGGFFPVYPRKEDVLARLAELDHILPPGELLYAAAYDENKTGAFLHVTDLDRISTRRSILVSNLVFHRFWANSHLLHKAGIGPGKIPQGVECDADGRPNGTLLEARGLLPLLPVIPDLAAITAAKVRRILPLFTAGGYTTVCEAALGGFGLAAAIDLFANLLADDAVHLRVVGLPFCPADAGASGLHGGGAGTHRCPPSAAGRQVPPGGGQALCGWLDHLAHRSHRMAGVLGRVARREMAVPAGPTQKDAHRLSLCRPVHRDPRQQPGRHPGRARRGGRGSGTMLSAGHAPPGGPRLQHDHGPVAPGRGSGGGCLVLHSPDLLLRR